MGLYQVFTKVAVTSGALLLMAGCSGRDKVAIAAKDDTIRKQETIIAQQQTDKDTAERMNAELAAQNKQLAEENAKQTVAMREKMSEKMSELEQLVKALGDKFTLAKAGSGGDANVSQGSNGIHITVAATQMFDPGKAELKSSAHSMLLNVAKTIKSRYPNNYLRIEGHTDSTPIVHSKGKFKDNMELSTARARSVYEFLAKQGGITASKMYTAGYGEYQPLVHPEKTAADRAKNRRVEIVIMPNDVKISKQQLAKK